MSIRQIRVWMLLVILAAAVAPDAVAARRLKLATQAPKGTSFHLILQSMAEKLRQAPDGGVALTIYTDGTMGSESDMVRRMRLGQLHAAMLTVSGLVEIDPGAAALQFMPMMFRDLEEVDHVRRKIEPRLAERMAKKGFVVLFWGDAGWVRFFSRTPALLPSDFKRAKMFAQSGDTIYLDIMRDLGYNPVPLEYSDLLTAMQTGMVDAIPTPPFYALAGQIYPLVPNMLEINWAPLVGATVLTSKAWDECPPPVQQALMAAAAEAGPQIQAKGRGESDQAVEAMKKRGLKVTTPPPDVVAKWRDFASAVYPRIRGSMVPADMFDDVQRILAEYRKNAKGSQ